MQKAYFTFFLFLVSTFIYAQDSLLDKKITVNYTSTQLAIILKDISEKYDIKLAYSDKQINTNQKITISVIDQPIWKIFNELFIKNGIEYKLVENQIVLTPLKKRNQITLSGYVREKDSKELLIGATIYIPSLHLGVSTNNYGFYSFNVPITNDSVEICYSLVGYENNCKKIYLVADQQEEIALTPLVLEEILVTSDKIEKVSEIPQMSQIRLSPQQVKGLPALMGEKDVMKVIQLMPGVQRGVEGTTGLFVRGGNSDQNLIILDDAVVYNANHLFGFMSVFNGDAIKSIEFTKGGFPAQYGGRLSSVLDMTMKDGDKNKFHGEGNIGLVSSSFTLEGPVKKGKSSFIVSARRTYVDLLMKPFLSKERQVGYYFYDLNAKINYDFGPKDKIYLSGYFGNDFYQSHFIINERFQNEDLSTKLGWGNATATLRWNHLFSDRVFANASLIFTNYNFDLSANNRSVQNNESQQTIANYHSGIQDISIKYDLDYFAHPHHTLKIGLLSTYHQFQPQAIVLKNDLLNLDKNDHASFYAFENALYLKDYIRLTNRLKSEVGLRWSNFYTQSKNYSYLEPRISMVYHLSPTSSMKSSYAYMNQFVHLLSTTGGVGMSIDFWVPSTDRVSPQASQQVVLGFVKEIPLSGLTFTLEGYYKNMNHIISYKEGASFLPVVAYLNDLSKATGLKPVDWQNNITQGKGWSYGIEFLVQKEYGRFTGWIGYTLAWTRVQFNEINLGKSYYPNQDRRHTISLVGVYQWKKNITLSATWVFNTGNPINIPLAEQWSLSPAIQSSPVNGGSFTYAGGREVTTSFSNRGSFRAESYHRLDIGIQFHKKKKWGERTWEISFYNAYSRLNPFYYTTTYTDGKLILKKIAIFPILPSISYHFKF